MYQCMHRTPAHKDSPVHYLSTTLQQKKKMLASREAVKIYLQIHQLLIYQPQNYWPVTKTYFLKFRNWLCIVTFFTLKTPLKLWCNSLICLSKMKYRSGGLIWNEQEHLIDVRWRVSLYFTIPLGPKERCATHQSKPCAVPGSHTSIPSSG